MIAVQEVGYGTEWHTRGIRFNGMAPVIKWQRWDSASYDWNGHGATDPVAAIEEVLDDWITGVNANASNVGRQVTKMRTYTDFSGNYNGQVVRFGANNNTDYGYFRHGTRGGTSFSFYMGDSYTDDTSNGGFGSVSTSNGGSSESSVPAKTSGQEASFLLCYDTTDEKEFFTFGPYYPSNYTYQYSNGWTFFKTTKGEWAMVANDYTTRRCYTYHDDALSTGWGNLSRNTQSNESIGYLNSTSSYYGRFIAYNGETGTATATLSDYYTVVAANEGLLYPAGGTSTLTGKRYVNTTEDPDRGIYLLTPYYNGPTIYVNVN